MKSIFIHWLHGCARCDGEGHANMRFEPLTLPVEYEGGSFTHWAPCPTNGEPILMKTSEKDFGESPSVDQESLSARPGASQSLGGAS